MARSRQPQIWSVMRWWRRRPFPAAVIAAVVALGVLSATAGAALTPVPVAVRAAVGIAVDEATDNVYVTSGSSSSVITVLTTTGAPKTLIEGVVGANAIIHAHDRSAVYVSLADQHAIGTIDPATNTVTKAALGRNVCPGQLAQVGGTLWFTYTDCTVSSQWMLGALRLSDGRVTLALGVSSYTPMSIASSPSLPNRLVVSSGPSVTVFDVTGGASATVLTVATLESVVGPVAVTADGNQVLAGWRGYSSSDLALQVSYGQFGDSWPIATRADGVLAMQQSANVIGFYQQGTSTPWRTLDPWPVIGYMRVISGAFGSRDLYLMVSTSDVLGNGVLQMLRIRPRRQSTVQFGRLATVYAYGAEPTIAVHLSGGATNRTVAVYARSSGRPEVLLKQGPVDANGNLSVRTRLTRNTTLRVQYTGDDAFDDAAASRTVYVRARVKVKISRTLGREGRTFLVRANGDAFATVTITPIRAGGCVTIVASGGGDGGSRSDCLRLGRDGTVKYPLRRIRYNRPQVRIRAEWPANGMTFTSESAWTYLRFVK